MRTCMTESVIKPDMGDRTSIFHGWGRGRLRWTVGWVVFSFSLGQGRHFRSLHNVHWVYWWRCKAWRSLGFPTPYYYVGKARRIRSSHGELAKQFPACWERHGRARTRRACPTVAYERPWNSRPSVRRSRRTARPPWRPLALHHARLQSPKRRLAPRRRQITTLGEGTCAASVHRSTLRVGEMRASRRERSRWDRVGPTGSSERLRVTLLTDARRVRQERQWRKLPLGRGRAWLVEGVLAK